MNHGFAQGNKRTAYAILEWFLHVNALGRLIAEDEELVSFCLQAENEKWSIEDIENWLRANIQA
jgi:prophage maintenance system killer protein